ncbi:MAG TPA: fasciclin domain-containing protein, partial [Chitinophagaceae bacterium]|nr:fasciclin domain-containing protein [Chitinophagaceae bacterium]
SVVITGCEKTEDEPAVIGNTIAGIILNDSNFSNLEAVMVKANVAITFDGTDPYTVFAPDNAAFAASGITPAVINGLSQAQAQTIFLYHSLISKVMAADLPAGPNAKVLTFHGDSVFITKDTNGVFVNGHKLIQPDIIADNGVLHKIDRVLNPPADNIKETVAGNGLDSLTKAIARATNDTTGDSGLDSVLNSSMVTMFAPDDSAFVHLLTSLSISNIDSIGIDTLVNVLKYHLAPGRSFSSDLSDGPLTMLSGGNATISLTNGLNGGPTITGANNGGNPSNITVPNIISRNGVVHIIDRVLIP